MADSEFLHHFWFGKQFLNCIVGGHWTDLTEYSLDKTVSEYYEVRIFYRYFEIGDTAFNECIDINHAVWVPVGLLSVPVPDRFWDWHTL